jgi:hypothetical protein
MARILPLLLVMAMAAFPQTKPEPLDGPNRPFHDDLLEHLQGRWKLNGTVMGQSREMELTAEWVLNHQFLLLREKDTSTISGHPLYDADIYIGYDNTSDRYVVHWD